MAKKEHQKRSGNGNRSEGTTATVSYNSDRNGIELSFSGDISEELKSKLRVVGFRASKFGGLWYAPKSNLANQFADRVVSGLPNNPGGPAMHLFPSFDPIKPNVEKKEYSYVNVTLKDGQSKSYVLFEPSKPKAEVIAIDFARKEFGNQFLDVVVSPRTHIREVRILFDEGKIMLPKIESSFLPFEEHKSFNPYLDDDREDDAKEADENEDLPEWKGQHTDPLANRYGVYTAETAGKNFETIKIDFPTAAKLDVHIDIVKTSQGNYKFGTSIRNDAGGFSGSANPIDINDTGYKTKTEALRAALIYIQSKLKPHDKLRNQGKALEWKKLVQNHLTKFAGANGINLKPLDEDSIIETTNPDVPEGSLDAAYWKESDNEYPQDKAVINGIGYHQARLRLILLTQLSKLSLEEQLQIAANLKERFIQRRDFEYYLKLNLAGETEDQKKAAAITVYIDDIILDNDILASNKKYEVLNYLIQTLFSGLIRAGKSGTPLEPWMMPQAEFLKYVKEYRVRFKVYPIEVVEMFDVLVRLFPKNEGLFANASEEPIDRIVKLVHLLHIYKAAAKGRDISSSVIASDYPWLQALQPGKFPKSDLLGYGFDATDFKSVESFLNLLRTVEASSNYKKCYMINPSGTPPAYLWEGRDIRIVTANNPLLTEGYASSIGIQGIKAQVLKAAEYIERHTESKGQAGLEYVDFSNIFCIDPEDPFLSEPPAVPLDGASTENTVDSSVLDERNVDAHQKMAQQERIQEIGKEIEKLQQEHKEKDELIAKAVKEDKHSSIDDFRKTQDEIAQIISRKIPEREKIEKEIGIPENTSIDLFSSSDEPMSNFETTNDKPEEHEHENKGLENEEDLETTALPPPTYHLKKFSNFLRQYPTIDGHTDNGLARSKFIRLGREALNELAEYLHLKPYQVSINKSGMASSGTLILMGMLKPDKGIYISFTREGSSDGLYRTIEDLKDFSGGTNHFFPEQYFSDTELFKTKIYQLIEKEVEAQPAAKSKHTSPKPTEDYIDRVVAIMHEKYANSDRATKKEIENLGVTLGITTLGKLWEAVELSWLLWYRMLYKDGGSFEARLSLMSRFWEKVQPTYAYSDSSKEIYKQYSTPCPIGAIVSEYTGMYNNANLTFDPSAGNGLLVMGANPSNTFVNEIDITRLDSLKFQGFKSITSHNAAQPFPEEFHKKFDVVVTNPPFAQWDDEQFDKDIMVQKVFDNHVGLNHHLRLEQVMAGIALQCMKDSGKAAMIIMNHVYFDSRGYVAKYRPFFNWLYRHYKIDDVININSFKLYNKQGAIERAMLILVDGRKSVPAGVAPRKEDAPHIEQMVDTFEDLWKRVKRHVRQRVHSVEKYTIDKVIQQLTIALAS